MTDDTAPAGFVRNDDGVLQRTIGGGRHYSAPDEAILTWYAGKLRFGCNHKVMQVYSSGPCGNAAKHDLDARGNPTKCGHHSAAGIAKKKAKQAERDAERIRRWADKQAKANHRAELAQIVKRIAEGHNDPRGLCQDWLARGAELGKEATQ